jgi:cell division protein FtsB
MKTTIKILTNKYLISTIVLSIWVVFFDKNDLLTQLDFSKQLNELEKERQYYLLEIESNKNKLVELQTNSANIEKFAREQYLMRKEGEDVFVVVHDSTVSIN